MSCGRGGGESAPNIEPLKGLDVKWALSDWLAPEAAAASPVGSLAGFGSTADFAKAAIAPLTAEASSRRYYRLSLPERTLVLMVGPDLKENRVWRDFGERLWQGGLPLPRIYAGDEARGLFLLEDLGDWRLDGLFASPAFASQKETLRPLLYAQAARILARWHRLAPKLLGDSPFFSHNPPYDRKFVLEAEWGYFLRGLKLLGLAVDWPALASEGDLLTQIPAKPPTVIHRDFQSRNLMVPRPCPNGGLWVLDWQGARPGPAAYDLASLIYDPYADLTEEETNLIVSEYLKERAEPGLRESLALVAPLRLAQAIGAYCHLSARGLPYGPYLAPALSRLAAALAKRASRAGFPKLKALIAQAQERAAGLFSGPAERPCPSLEPPKPPKEAP